MKKNIEKILHRNLEITNRGKLADYIPALNITENKKDIGVTIIDADENVIGCGDYKKNFTIQSISKILTLMLAIKDKGLEYVFSKVGYEGTDDPFNTFTKLDLAPHSRPANPMINSGALVITSLVDGDGDEKFLRILEFSKTITQNSSLSYNEDIYLSELKANDRNRSIAYLLKSKNLIEGDIPQIMDTYCKQCSIEVNTVDLARIGKYISSGCSYLLEKRGDNDKITRIIKGILLGCGMYDYSTEYSINVGIPSKSGVGGGIMGVLPKSSGIGVYSPSLDEYGNSIAGIEILKDISKEYNYNIFNKY